MPEALRSADRIRNYIAQFDPGAADRLVTRLVSAGNGLSDYPDRWREVPGGRRELPAVPPYIIRYRVFGDRVLILSIRHGRRRPPER